MRFPTPSLAGALLFVAVAGCASSDRYEALPAELRELQVTSAHSAPIRDGATWSWRRDSTVQLDGRYDAADVERQIRELLAEGLAARGFRQVASGGDYAIGYALAVGRALGDEEIDRRHGVVRDAAAPAMRHERGALVVDVIDGNARPAWRGSVALLAQPELPEAVRRERVRRGIDMLLAQFLPGR